MSPVQSSAFIPNLSNRCVFIDYLVPAKRVSKYSQLPHLILAAFMILLFKAFRRMTAKHWSYAFNITDSKAEKEQVSLSMQQSFFGVPGEGAGYSCRNSLTVIVEERHCFLPWSIRGAHPTQIFSHKKGLILITKIRHQHHSNVVQRITLQSISDNENL